MKRRNFVKSSLFAGVGGLFAGYGLAPSLGEFLNGSDRGVLKSLSSLFPRILVEEFDDCRARKVVASVSIDEVDSFLDESKRSKSLPELQIRADGQCLSFRKDDTDYVIRLLMPDDFARRSGTPFSC